MRRLFSFGLMLLCLIGGAAQAAVRASLDNDRIGTGDTVQLTLARDGQTDASPDLAPLKQDFDVLSVGRSSNVQIINGSLSSSVEAQIVLSPKHSGQLTVPAISWGGEISQPLTLTVSDAAGGTSSTSSATGASVFVSTKVDDQNPYVQGAVDVTVRVYTAEQLYQASLDFPSGNDVLVQQVGSDQNSNTEKNGRQYQVIERHYVLFPQHSGQIRLPGAVLAGQVPVRIRDDSSGNDPFADLLGAANGMAGTKPIRVHGDPIVLDVRPRPAASGSGPWLPAQGVSLSAQWHPQSMQVHAGDPITLELRLQADGLTAAQLPDLSTMLALPQGLKAYPDQAKLKNDAQDDLVLGSRDQNLALIADRPGRYVLPALHLSWWDTKADQARDVEVPAQTLDILPAAGGAAASAPTVAAAAAARATGGAEPPASAPAPIESIWRQLRNADRPWILVSVGLGLLWIVTMLGWWISRRRPPRETAAPTASAPVPASAPPRPETAPARSAPAAPASVVPTAKPVDAAGARKKFHEACGRHDAPAARHRLLAWIAAAWPEPAPAGLSAFARKLSNPAQIEALAELERACYAGADWNGENLASLFKDLPRAPAAAGARDSGIAPLYPEN